MMEVEVLVKKNELVSLDCYDIVVVYSFPFFKVRMARATQLNTKIFINHRYLYDPK